MDDIIDELEQEGIELDVQYWAVISSQYMLEKAIRLRVAAFNEARKISDPIPIPKIGPHKAQQIIFRNNAECEIKKESKHPVKKD